MKKLYLLVFVISITIVSLAQQSSQIQFDQKQINSQQYDYLANPPTIHPFVDLAQKKRLDIKNKAFLDTLAYEDFDISHATAKTHGIYRWTVGDPNNNGNVFIGDTVLPTGVSTPGFDRIRSTTGSTGFIGLPADNYNSPRPTQLREMETTITSGPIPLKHKAKSVYLDVQQLFARCCYFAPMMYLEVSADSVSWDTIAGIQENTPLVSLNVNTNGIRPYTLNISQTAANEDTIYIRFRASRMSLFFWMFDDVTILEGPRHDLTLMDPQINFNSDSYDIAPFYSRIPCNYLSPLYFQATIVNGGWDTARNTSLLTDAVRIMDLTGIAASDTMSKESEFIGDLAPFPNGAIVVEQEELDTNELGLFRVNYAMETDSVDQIANRIQAAGVEADSLFYIVNDTVFARDDGGFSPSFGIGPVSISQGPSVGGFNGDACGTLYNLEPKDGNKIYPTSVSFYVSDNPANVGISISPSVWIFVEDTDLVTNAWHPEDFLNNTGLGLVQFGKVYQVSASDTNSWLTLALDTTAANFKGLDSGQYVVGWEVISGSTTARDVYFEVANDLSTARRQPAVTSFLYHKNTLNKTIIFNSSTTQFQPVIRLNLGEGTLNCNLPIGIDEPNHSKHQRFEAIPNPSNGELKINIIVEEQAAYQLKVRNILGQVVYEDVISVNGQITERLNLAHLEKGLYVISLENAVERLQQKIILN